MSEIEWADLASENQRLRERVAELEADASASSSEDERGHALIDDADGENERTTSMSTLAERVEALLDQRERLRDDATKAERERDAALAQVAVLQAHVRKGDRFIGAVERAEKAEAQVAELRWALTRLILECDDAFDGDGPTGLIPGGVAYDDARAALAATPAPTRAEAEAWLRAGEPVRGALAVPAEPDYSGLCAAPSCEGHCGYVHARGCEAVREYLADHGGEPYRAPSKEATRG